MELNYFERCITFKITTYSNQNHLLRRQLFMGGRVFGLFCCFDLKCSLQDYWKLKTSNLLKTYNVIIIPIRKETNLLKESYHLQAQVIKEMYTINHQSIIKMYKINQSSKKCIKVPNRSKCFFSHFLG